MGIPQGNPMPRRHAPWRACPVPGDPSRAPKNWLGMGMVLETTDSIEMFIQGL